MKFCDIKHRLSRYVMILFFACLVAGLFCVFTATAYAYGVGEEGIVEGGIITETNNYIEKGEITNRRLIDQWIEEGKAPAGTISVTYTANLTGNKEIWYVATVQNADGTTYEEYLTDLSAEEWAEEQGTTALTVTDVAGIFFNNALFDESTAFGNTVASALTGIGTLLVLVYTVYAIYKEFQRGTATMEMWARVLIKMVIAVMLLMYMNDILSALSDLGNLIVQGFYDAVSSSFGTDALQDQFAVEGAGASSVWITIMSFIVRVYIRIVCYSIAIELIIRRAFMPIAVASIVTEGIRGPGFRWVKRLVGVYMKMGIIILCMGLAWYLSAVQGGGIVTIAIYLAGIVFMGRGSEIAEQAMGI